VVVVEPGMTQMFEDTFDEDIYSDIVQEEIVMLCQRTVFSESDLDMTSSVLVSSAFKGTYS
jgi:hypothetical protein